MLSRNAGRAVTVTLLLAIVGPWVLLWVGARRLSRTNAAVETLQNQLRWLDDPNSDGDGPGWSLFNEPIGGRG